MTEGAASNRNTAVLLVRWVILCVALLTTVSCSSKVKSPYTLAPVSGKITYEDGTPISTQPIVITFWPQIPAVSEKEAPPKGVGSVDPKDGSFSLTAHEPNDGATVGMNRITLGPNLVPLPEIPDDYLTVTKTPLEVEVKPGTNSFMDLKVKKPMLPAGKVPPKR